MEEITIRIGELYDQIIELENSVKSQLNYGNVPAQNWELTLSALNQRKIKLIQLRELEDIRETILKNS